MKNEVQLPAGIDHTVLPNGIDVVTETLPGVRSATVGIWVDVGSVHEIPPLEGATHFLEHLLFKGTKRRTSLEVARVMDTVGGDMNAFTAKEYTAFYARCLDRDLPDAIDVLGDMLSSSTIAPAEVETERGVVLEEILMHLDDPADLVHSEFSQAWFGDTPLGREVLGTRASMTAMTRDQVAGWWHDRYTSDAVTVAAAGNVEHDQIVALVEQHLGAMPRQRGVVEPESSVRDEPAERVRVCSRQTEQAHLVMGGRGLSRGHDLRWALAVLNQALGGGMASRLFQEVRERRGLAYSVYSYPSAFADTGTFCVYAGTAASNAREVVKVIGEELQTVLADGLTDEQLERAKGYLSGSVVLALEDTSSRMTRMGRAVLTGMPMLGLDELISKITAVTHEDIAAVTEQVVGGPWALAAVGPINADDLGWPDIVTS